jgi:ectoine hydroxylase-related dioxygenase (phytanoyl-CoA dioxygenase family)
MKRTELEAIIARYRADGFVHVRDVLTPAEVDRYRSAVDDAVASRKARDRRSLAEKSPYEQSFIQCEYLWEDFPGVRPLTFHSRIAGLAAALLGADRVRLWHDQALYKEPGGRETDAHQDYAYWPMAEPAAVTAWVPLVDIDETIGCMGYVAGSQNDPTTYVDIFRMPGSGQALMERYRDHPPTFVPARAGDVIFHAATTVHLAKPNISGRMRRVHTAIFFSDGCRRAETGDHPSLARNGTAPGGAIEGPATPIAWPLPGGRLPEPAPWPDLGKFYARAAELGVVPRSAPQSGSGG